MFGFLFKNKKLDSASHQLFLSVIDNSRTPFFYSDLNVEDSLDGRFDVMAIHMAIVLDKFDQHDEKADAATIKRIIQEIMFDNLDLTLREIGVGDLAVGKKIKVMAEAFYGRMMVYQDLFRTIDEEKMSEALLRNLYRGKEVKEDVIKKMAAYVYQQHKNVINQNIDDILLGEIAFIKPNGE